MVDGFDDDTIDEILSPIGYVHTALSLCPQHCNVDKSRPRRLDWWHDASEMCIKGSPAKTYGMLSNQLRLQEPMTISDILREEDPEVPQDTSNILVRFSLQYLPPYIPTVPPNSILGRTSKGNSHY